MQVLCDEAIANHIGPEPCSGIREAVGEASVEGTYRRAIEPRHRFVLGADAVCRRTINRDCETLSTDQA